MENRLIIIFGRFQPLTVGHSKLFDQLLATPGERHCVLLGQKFGDSENPLDILTKSKLIRDVYPTVDVVTQYKSPFDMILSEGDSYSNITVICGTDRRPDFIRLQKYTKTPIDVVVIDRDKVSGSMVRQVARNDDFLLFSELYGGTSASSMDVYNKIRGC